MTPCPGPNTKMTTTPTLYVRPLNLYVIFNLITLLTSQRKICFQKIYNAFKILILIILDIILDNIKIEYPIISNSRGTTNHTVFIIFPKYKILVTKDNLKFVKNLIHNIFSHNTNTDTYI